MEDNEQEVEELRHSVFHNKRMEEERALSDSKYAIKLVENVVFGMVGVILLAVVTALVALVVNS